MAMTSSLIQKDDVVICNIFDGIYGLIIETLKKMPLSFSVEPRRIISKESGTQEYIKTIQESDIVVSIIREADEFYKLTKVECLNSSVQLITYKL